jgi:hypothetical protein
MKLQLRPGDLIHMTQQYKRKALDPSMNRQQMKAVERQVHHARETPFDRHEPSDQVSHQASDGRESAEGHERSVVTIYKRYRELAADQTPDIPICRRSHLVCGLRSRRHGPLFALRDVVATISYRKDPFIARCLQRRFDDKLTGSGGFEGGQVIQDIWSAHASRPNLYVRLDFSS